MDEVVGSPVEGTQDMSWYIEADLSLQSKQHEWRRSRGYILSHTPHVSLLIRITLYSFFFISS